VRVEPAVRAGPVDDDADSDQLFLFTCQSWSLAENAVTIFSASGAER
jgi:hypothetical protein